jgi:hypothetical protein
MDGIVKIVLALKLKFLLIILSIGTSYLVEHKLKQQKDTVPAGVITSSDSNQNFPGHTDAKPVPQKVFIQDSTGPGSGGHPRVQPLNYVSNRPVWHKGLEIYIVL